MVTETQIYLQEIPSIFSANCIFSPGELRLGIRSAYQSLVGLELG